MGALVDITGQKFGKLTVVGRDYSKKGNTTYWFCECDCGSDKIISVAKGSLTQGLTTSCGCNKKKSKKKNKYDLSGKYGIGWTTNTNREFYFDLEDYNKIKDYCWMENQSGYVVTQSGRETIRLHRLILGLEKGNPIQVDHVFHNTFDNRKEFLRQATNSQNGWNKKCNGVYYNSEKNKYVAFVTCNGKKIFKYFKTKEEALQYRKELENVYYGEFAYKEICY